MNTFQALYLSPKAMETNSTCGPLSTVSPYDFFGAIGATVDANDHFDLARKRFGGASNRFEAAGQIFFFVARGDNDGKFRVQWLGDRHLQSQNSQIKNFNRQGH